ncbi:GNAT family N-acetyltransferase [Streptomyces sp. NPDC057253]|uniref:GNAT family N-acetyltransferase n=1 Tax=Streptomyces sp. NPDC057253 TaxID=3346069 RepID=UPI0036350982
MTSDNTGRFTFPPHVRLTSEGLILREWTDDDLPAMAALFDDPDIAHWTPLASPFDAAAARAYLDRARQERGDGLRLRLAITTDGRLPQGEILLIRTSTDSPTASLGYTVGAAHRGRRLAARALKVMTDYAHHTMGLPRVTLGIEAENGASVAVAHAANFHVTDEPLIPVINKGRPLVLQTWAHDRT